MIKKIERAAVLPLIALLLGGCASTLSVDTAQRNSVNQAFPNANCPTLTAALQSDIAQMAAADDTELRERAAPAPTVARAFMRMVGPQGAGEIAQENLEKMHAHAVALNDQLREKGCPTRDIDEEVKAGEVKPWSPAATH